MRAAKAGLPGVAYVKLDSGQMVVPFRQRAEPVSAQAILFRGAGLSVVWPQFLALAGIGSVLFAFALRRFRGFLK